MLNITFTQRAAFDLSCIPEQWREYVTVMRVPFLRPVGTVEERSLPPMYYTRVTIAVQPDDSSYRYRALMQARQLVLKFALPFFFEFPVGSSVVYDGQTYYVKRPEDIKKQGEKNIEYSMTLSADDANLGDYKMRNSVDGRLKWSMCAKPHEFIEEIVKNLNEREGADKWKVGTCLESSEKTVEFNHTYLDAALADIATAFETEYEITPDCYIHLRKVEYNGDEPLPLSYGRGNGFVPGVGRTSEVGGEPVKRLYVQGTDRNIDRSTYGDLLGLNDKPGELLLPLGQEIDYEGRTYRSDAHGYYIERIDQISTATKEDSLDCSEIYPSRVGKCTNLIATDPAKNYYDFVDDTIPANLDFNSYLIAGETMTVIFQTGMLSGNDREFEVKYYHDSVNGKPARRFEIVPQEIDGITMPNDTFKPKFGADGDTYAVFGIQLPPEYICNNDDKSGASWDMMREAARKLYDCEEQKFTFTGEMQSMWAKRNWEQIGGKIVVGGYVWFTDNQFAPNGTAIRIVGIKDYLTKPYAPTIELSNAIASPGSVSNSLRQIDNTEVVIDDTKKSIIRYTKRRFRDALETIGMLEDAQLENFNSAISPVAIQTMAMLVGDESLQFLMGKTIATIGSGDWGIKFADNALTAPTGYLRHMTIGVNSITANREMVDYYTWQMPKMNLTPKSGAKYYLYAVVNRTGFTFNESLGANICNTPGTWLLLETSHKIDENSGTFHLLVGVLNSEYNGERSFATLYGFTEILPGRMTTDRIVCSDGKSFLDLAKSAFVLGDSFDYNSQGDKALRLKFLLSENANLGGWIFKNNRLESQNGNVWLDGINGDVRLTGTMQLSSNYTGNYSDANLFYLKPSDDVRNITMGYEKEDIGKVVRLYNNNPFGGKSVIVHLAEFYINGNVTDVTRSITAEIAPQETIEVTCFRLPPRTSGEIAAMWTITNRFGLENFRNKTECGRYPQLIAMGTIYGKENPQISGTCWNGESVSNVYDISRISAGHYLIKRKDGKMISPIGHYFVMMTGWRMSNGDKITACSGDGTDDTGVQFHVFTSAGNSVCDGYVNFLIFNSRGWEYNAQ